MGFIALIIGGVALAAAVFGKEFYVADVDSGSGFKPDQRRSTWSGRLVCIIVGLGFIAIGIKLLARR